VNLEDLAQTIWARLNELAILPVAQFFRDLDQGDRTVLYALLATAGVVGFVFGRRRVAGGRRGQAIRIGRRRFPAFQNIGEAVVSDVLASHFGPPDYHLMNHVTIRLDDGTTQVDHILLSRFGVFVIETKHYTGWLFAHEADRTWTQVRFRRRFKFQNPILQNARHVRAVGGLLDFLPPGAIKSLVVFTGSAEFKTEVPQGVIGIGQLAEYVGRHTEEVMALNRLQFCVGRLETARLAISAQTDVEHIQSLARRHGHGAA
jgi:Nuclease-related domain